MDRVFDDPSYVFVVEGTAGLVTRLEVEYLAVAAAEGASCAENVTGRIPSGKDNIVGRGNVEGLGVELLGLKSEHRGKSRGDGMRGIHVPDDLGVIISPGKVARSTHKAHKGL